MYRPRKVLMEKNGDGEPEEADHDRRYTRKDIKKEVEHTLHPDIGIISAR